MGEVLVLGAIFTFLLWPWWAALGITVAGFLTGRLLIDSVIPLVAVEAFGSPSDTKRASIHFWLVAPVSLGMIIAVIVIMLRREVVMSGTTVTEL